MAGSLVFPSEYVMEKINGVDTPCPVYSVCAVMAAGSVNNVVVNAVTGKRARIVSGSILTNGVASNLILHDGLGNAHLNTYVPATAGAAQIPIQWPFNPLGWINGALSDNIYGDAGAGAIVVFNFTYYLYTP